MRKHQIPRRVFLKQAGIGSMAALGAATLPPVLRAAADNTQPIKITRVDFVTFRKDIAIGGDSGGHDNSAEWSWIRLHTDNGLVGTGETYAGVPLDTVKSYARRLMRHDPRDIDVTWRELYFDMAMRNAGGGDMHVLSAINMAQLDILGQASGLPLYRLLGGKTRDSVRVYNTTTDYWAINGTKMGPDTMKIVHFLLDRGIGAIKIYPFEGAAVEPFPVNRDGYISNQALEQGLKCIREIRDGVGNAMDICVDTWGQFNLPSAERIAKALEPYNILYLEDAMLSSNVEAYAQLARETSVPICISETLATRYEYRPFLERKACDVVMYDLTWCGGVTEAKKIADLADAYMIPVSPHTCGGPLLYICSAHLSMAVPNLLIMESNYWKYTHQYPHFVENAPVPVKGAVTPPELPGIGAGIKPEIFSNGDAIVQTVAGA